MNILGISGSLRAASINSALLRAAMQLAPAGVHLHIFPAMGLLPLFNPDLEPSPPKEVVDFRELVGNADALLIASPEYAHGMTGVLKNALDWLVGYERFALKPVAVINASPRSRHADAALREVLRTMAAHIVEPASVTLPILGAGLDVAGMLGSADVATQLRHALACLAQASAAATAMPHRGLMPV